MPKSLSQAVVQDVDGFKQGLHENMVKTTATEILHETILLHKYCSTQQLVRLTSN